ncbi:MAG: hypothetical protein MHM6MM_004906, partial [Cercozoa sp. M6MM]
MQPSARETTHVADCEMAAAVSPPSLAVDNVEALDETFDSLLVSEKDLPRLDSLIVDMFRSLGLLGLHCSNEPLETAVQLPQKRTRNSTTTGETGDSDSTSSDESDLSPEHALRRLLGALRNSYRGNPYHNWRHAVQVTTGAFRILRCCRAPLRRLDAAALLLGALCHDVAHPGVANSALVSVGAKRAKRFNDQSVNEHESLRRMFAFLEQSEFAALLRSIAPTAAAQKSLRHTLIRLLLATDIESAESRELSKMRWRSACQQLELLHQKQDTKAATETDAAVAETTVSLSDETRVSLLSMMLLCADVGIVAAPFEISVRWAEALFLELSLAPQRVKTLHFDRREFEDVHQARHAKRRRTAHATDAASEHEDGSVTPSHTSTESQTNAKRNEKLKTPPSARCERQPHSLVSPCKKTLLRPDSFCAG